MKQDLEEALILAEHSRDAIAAAAKLVDCDGEIYARMLKSSLALTEVVGEIQRAREDRATDALIGLSIREQSTT